MSFKYCHGESASERLAPSCSLQPCRRVAGPNTSGLVFFIVSSILVDVCSPTLGSFAGLLEGSATRSGNCLELLVLVRCARAAALPIAARIFGKGQIGGTISELSGFQCTSVVTRRLLQAVLDYCTGLCERRFPIFRPRLRRSTIFSLRHLVEHSANAKRGGGNTRLP